MATIDPIRFGDVALQVLGIITPAVYDTLCGITTLTKTTNVNTQTEDLPDCADADAVGFESATKISVGVQYAFQGFVDAEASDVLDDLAFEDDDVTVRLVYNKPGKIGYYQGPAILTASEENYERRTSGKMSGTLKLTARPVWTATG